MKEEIKKMDQAVADSSSFIKRMKSKDPQQIAYEKTISDFWDTSDVPQGSLPIKIASYPSLESLNEEPKDESTESDYEYYDKKRKILVEKMAIANDVYLAHLQNYDQKDPKNKNRKFLYQFSEVGNRLHKQFDIVAKRLRLPLEQPLMTYPSLGNLRDVIQQEDMGDKNREYFQEMAKEVKIKNDIAQKVLNNRLSVVKTPAEKGKANLQYKEYQKESKKLLDFCEKMMGKREKEADSLELEQPEGVPEVKEISKEKLNEKLKEIIDQPQYVKPIGENTLLPYYSREMSRYEPPNPIKQKERENLIEKVKEITGEESKGGKREKSVEVDTDLSWDHEGLKPLPKAPKDKLNESPKPPRTPKVPKAKVNAVETFKKEHPAFSGDSKEGKYPEIPHKENKDRREVPSEKKQDPGIGKKSGQNDKRWDFKSPENPVDKKTARWIEEQNEFLGKEKEKEFERDKKERDPPIFNPNGPVKVLQKQRATHHTGYEQPPQHLMGAQRDQAPHPPMVVTNRGDGSWRSQGKRYPLKERQRTQWGGYGKQYGAGGERRSYPTYRTDGTQTQSYNTAYESQRQGSYFPTKSTGNEQGRNGGSEDRNDKKKYRDTRINHENDSHEESDTEDYYEFEITSQQLSQVTPGGGALKIKLSKKKPLKITAGAPNGQSETIPMELEHIRSPKRSVPSSHVDTTSDSTLPTRGAGAPLFITPIHLENNERPQKGTSTKKANDLKSSTNHGLTKERVTQVQASDTRGSQGPVRVKNPPGNGGGGDSSGETSGDQRFPGGGRGPPRRNGNQAGGGDDDDPDPSDDGDGDDSSSSTDSSAPRKRKHKSPKCVYVLQGPPGPKGQEGQPGQAGRDGRDGQNLSLTKELEETLKAHRPNLDTTGLENSFDQFGRTIFEVLNAQHRTNQKLEEQFRRANETQEYQAEAMQDMAQANSQMKYDHMFAGVPMYDGTDPDSFDDWPYQIESLCELSHRDVWVELMGRASAQVKRIIRSLPMDIEWEIAQRELKRCLTEEKSRAHSAFKLDQIKQKPNENLRIFILRYQDLHSAATGKTAAEDTDPTHIIRFLGMMTNSEIARKITQKGIPEGMTLGQAFTRAIELEAGYQLSEGVSLARPPEIMQVQEIEEIDEIAALQRRFRDVVCWGCGEKGDLYRDCPHRRENMQDDEYDDSNEYAGKSEQVIRITQPITVATRDNIYKNMATQRTRANLYKTGYRRTKAALQEQQKINAAMSCTLAAQNQTVTTSPRVVQPKTVKTQVTQNPNTITQAVQVPTTPGTPGAGNVPAWTGQVRYIRVSPGTTKTAYNLRSTPSTKATTVTTSATVTTAVAPVAVGRGGSSPQMVQVKQEPAPPENVTTPKTSSTIVRRGKGRGQKTSTVSVVDALPEGSEYLVEVGEEDLEGSDSDPAELYEILAEINGSEDEIEEGLEPEIEPPI